MRTENAAVSEETLHRLWSELALLRREVEQAESDLLALQIKLDSDVVAARHRIQTLRSRPRCQLER